MAEAVVETGSNFAFVDCVNVFESGLTSPPIAAAAAFLSDLRILSIL